MNFGLKVFIDWFTIWYIRDGAIRDIWKISNPEFNYSRLKCGPVARRLCREGRTVTGVTSSYCVDAVSERGTSTSAYAHRNRGSTLYTSQVLVIPSGQDACDASTLTPTSWGHAWHASKHHNTVWRCYRQDPKEIKDSISLQAFDISPIIKSESH